MCYAAVWLWAVELQKPGCIGAAKNKPIHMKKTRRPGWRCKRSCTRPFPSHSLAPTPTCDLRHFGGRLPAASAAVYRERRQPRVEGTGDETGGFIHIVERRRRLLPGTRAGILSIHGSPFSPLKWDS